MTSQYIFCHAKDEESVSAFLAKGDGGVRDKRKWNVKFAMNRGVYWERLVSKPPSYGRVISGEGNGSASGSGSGSGSGLASGDFRPGLGGDLAAGSGDFRTGRSVVAGGSGSGLGVSLKRKDLTDFSDSSKLDHQREGEAAERNKKRVRLATPPPAAAPQNSPPDPRKGERLPSGNYVDSYILHIDADEFKEMIFKFHGMDVGVAAGDVKAIREFWNQKSVARKYFLELKKRHRNLSSVDNDENTAPGTTSCLDATTLEAVGYLEKVRDSMDHKQVSDLFAELSGKPIRREDEAYGTHRTLIVVRHLLLQILRTLLDTPPPPRHESHYLSHFWNLIFDDLPSHILSTTPPEESMTSSKARRGRARMADKCWRYANGVEGAWLEACKTMPSVDLGKDVRDYLKVLKGSKDMLDFAG
ncbi:hypothetical protein HK097_009052, partial [Rhizophlyctis rosea]